MESEKKPQKPDNIPLRLQIKLGVYTFLERFDKLLLEYKIVFVAEKYLDIKSVVYLKGFKRFCKLYRIYKKNGVLNIWMTQNLITGKRFIDQFDFVSWFNSITEGEKDER